MPRHRSSANPLVQRSTNNGAASMNGTRLPRVFRTKTRAGFMQHRFAMTLRGLVVGGCLWLMAAPAVAALSKNEIRELEDLLARIGFDPGPVDGVLDAQTRAAIKVYQDFAALPVTGQESRGLLDELRGVTESLDEIRIREAAAQAVAGPETVRTQEAVTQPMATAPKPPGPKPPAPVY